MTRGMILLPSFLPPFPTLKFCVAFSPFVANFPSRL
jgi:hypothetical protein